MMSSDAFDVKILAEKLSKLNNSQQSIESLSRWCISHRKKARHIVETWEKVFHSRQRDQRVSFLYLANDILQNSRRKGNEFVNEFWKVLPAVLKQVFDNGDELGKKAVTRLVDIWEERKVFGSRGQGLKDELLGKHPPPPLTSNGKSSSAIKIVKKDDNFVRLKLAIGSLPEKIITAFQTVVDEHHSEDDALSTFTAAVTHAGKIKDEAENTTPGTQQALANDLQEQENVLKKCIEKLEGAEAKRSMLLSELKEALNEQELKLEMIQSQMHVARNHIELVSGFRKRLTSPFGSSTATNIPVSEAIRVMESNKSPVQPSSTLSQAPLMQPMVSFAPLKTTNEESKKAAAAAVAAKLAASTSSAQMFTSILSSLVAGEAASMNSSLSSSGFNSLSHFPPEKRQKLESIMPTSDVGNSDAGKAAYFASLQQQTGTTSLSPIFQSGQMQSTFGFLPPLPQAPPPSITLANPAASQCVQSTTGMMPYGYGANTLPPPPLLPPHIAIGMGRPGSQTQQSPPQQIQPQQLQQAAASSGYYRPPGIGFYGQNHQATPPPVPRQ